MGISQHEISRRWKISHCCVRQTFSRFHSVATEPGTGRPPKVTGRAKRLIKLQQLRDDIASYDMLIQN